MKIRISLTALCALLAVACTDNAAPDDLADLGSTRDRGVLGGPDDASVPELDVALDADDGVPVLDPEPGPDPEPMEPEPDVMEPEPGGDCAAGETRLCTESCGVATCTAGQFGPCNPSGELCNGHDDNCDGRIDEGYAGLGVGCVLDMNGCSSQGTRICGPDARSVICEAPPVMPAPEVCNGDDDDCDGRVDEDFPGRICCSDDLQCGPGETCEAGECTGGVGPGPGPNPGVGCADDFDCDFFEVCVAGTCRDFCFSDLDCGFGEACDFGACVPAGPECLDDLDCFGFEVCQNGACGPPPPPPCVADDECPGAQTCQNGACALPPGAGSCDAPVLMNGFGVYRGSNLGGFDTLGNGCAAADDGPEQVFEFTLDFNARISLDTNGSNFDTVLSVLEGCAAAAPELVCDDDGGDGTRSVVGLDVRAGVTYFAVVNGYDDLDTGDIVLNFAGVEICLADADCPEGRACDDGTCVVPPCVADADCLEGEVCRAGICGPPPPPLCEGGIQMDGFGDYLGSNVGAADRIDGACGNGALNGPEQIFTFQLDAPGPVVLDSSGAAVDTVMSVWSDCNDAALVCDDDGGEGLSSRLVLQAEAGVRYYVVLEGYDNADVGDLPLSFIGPPPPCDDACPGPCVNNICAPPVPAACAGATIADALPAEYQGSTVGLVDQHSGSCGRGASPDDILLVAFPFDTVVTVSTDGSVFDTVLYVLEGCGAEIACDDDSGLGTQSALTFDAEAGVPYYIVVDGYNGASGAFTLSVAF